MVFLPPDEEVWKSRRPSGSWKVVGLKVLQQIIHPICHDSPLGFALLGCRIPPFVLRCENPLRRHAGLMKRDAAVWPDIFAQMRPRTARAGQDDEHLAALGCDLHAEPGISSVSVDDIR
jgi:hypothetical protein